MHREGTSSTARVFNEDKISEVYKGGKWSERLTKVARSRIDWMCNQAIGKHVLDVGCSQGITSILLARKGFEVTGIDIFPGAISYAEADAANEPEEIRQKLSFVLSSLEDYNPKPVFDTIIMGEVLEHQEKPDDFVRQAVQRLKPGGRLVMTTPFGYEPHEDHKSALFPSWFRQFQKIGLEFYEIDVQSNYIFAAATLKARGEALEDLQFKRLLRLTERGTVNSQRRLYATIQDRSNRLARLEQSIAASEHTIGAIKPEHSGIVRPPEARAPEINKAFAAPSSSDVREIVSDVDFGSFDSPEISLLRQYEHIVRESQRARMEMQLLRESASYQIGQTILQARQGAMQALKMPFSLLSLMRTIFSQRQNLAQQALKSFANAPVPTAPDKPTGLFLTRETQWVEASVEPKRRYRISGTINSARAARPNGAKIVLRFVDRAEKAISYNDDVFIWQQRHSRAACYAQSGRYSIFSAEITAPEGAELVRIGFERSFETAPVYLQIMPIEEVTVGDATVVPQGLSPLRNRDLPTVGAIMDEFTQECFAPEVNLISVSKQGWHQELENKELFSFFAESAWRGNGGQWKYAMTQPEKWGKELDEILAWCRSNNVPTLFWNKEDPVNFDVFRETAKKFQYIFTTDSGRVPAYRDLVGHNNVHTLAFAAQPELHNPIRTAPLVDRFAFTGSWRGVKYPQRAEWLELLLGPIMERKRLDIFDRFAGEKRNPDLIFPDKFQPALRGALDYHDLVEQVYKRYLAFVSVNSVEDSDTMLARRVFELLACGAPVISSPSPAIEKTFGDIVLTPRTKSEVSETVDRLMNEPLYRDRLGVKGVRLVHSQHTYRHRMEQIGEAIGKPLVSQNRKKVSILCCSKRPHFLAHLAEQVSRQTYRDSEILFVAHAPEFTDDAVAAAFSKAGPLNILRISEDKFLADGLNLAMNQASGDYFAKFDDDDHYGPDYLTDTMLAFGYASEAGIVGKQSFFAFIEGSNQTVLRFPDRAYRFAPHVHGGTIVWERRKTEGIRFTPVRQGTDTRFLASCREQGVPIFSSDPFNFVHVRYADANNHTWKISDTEFIANTSRIGTGLQLDKVFA
jgi:spore maturation protein CgeB/cyclopropane fatty-acyl-phospholipid synthase-like methyltransferase